MALSNLQVICREVQPGDPRGFHAALRREEGPNLQEVRRHR